ncbi:MAG: alpha-amylase family glycosyl hydrolase [Bacteroidales bacterium]
MKHKHLSLFFTAYLTAIFCAMAQVVSTMPTVPVHDQSVIITFDASKGSGGLAGYTGSVYAHTGVITNKSISSNDWKYVLANWGENLDKVKLTHQGGDIWQLSITSNIRQYYGVPQGEKILQMAFVFRSADSQKKGKDTGGKDILINVSENDFTLAITSPRHNSIYKEGSNVQVSATSSKQAQLSLYSNGRKLTEQASATQINHTLDNSAQGSYTIIAKAIANNNTRSDTLQFVVRSATETAPLPNGLQAGINYDASDDTKATLVLFAPYKEYVYVVGDFNQWTVLNEYQMKQDGDRFWIQLEGLTPSKEYAFQYYIDGTLYIADPYTEKILDPWNDQYITPATYPHLKDYPHGKATGIVSVLQTAQTPYTWSNKSYTRPDKTKLNIYELLVRDFVKAHNYATIIDSLNYFKQLGINAIELLPTNEFEGNESWGYNPSFFFAPDKYYGAKNELKRFVDSCHANGIAVIIDLVLNHAFGQNPMVQMYWNEALSQPSVNSPWFNSTSPNPVYYWGADFNHESPHTQALVDRINHFWLSEYKIDGIRFDFTKGFTNTAGDGWRYDAARIAILKRMADAIRRTHPYTYIIFEHLTDNAEEMELADYEILLWGNLNHQASEAIMGYNTGNKSDLSEASYKNKKWTKPNLIAYMESHDEERMMYKAQKWGNTNGSYQVTSEYVATLRARLCATVFFAIPGPKMLWQFGELGYDYSINACPDGTESEDCRTSNKAIRWDYLKNDYRKNLYYHYTETLALRNSYDIFHTTNFNVSLQAAVKTVQLLSDTMNIVVVGNFDVKEQTAILNLPTQGDWYEYFSQSTHNANNLKEITFTAGEYRIYSDKKMERLNLPYATGIFNPKDTNKDITMLIYPNPAYDMVNINIRGIQRQRRITLSVYSVLGKLERQQSFVVDSDTLSETLQISELASGHYIVVLQTSEGNALKAKMFVKVKG